MILKRFKHCKNYDPNTLFLLQLIAKKKQTILLHSRKVCSFLKSCHFGASGRALEDDEELARPVVVAINVIGLTPDSIGVDWWDGSGEPGGRGRGGKVVNHWGCLISLLKQS